MSQQNIYQVQLLNDLHNHFPEVLYNPGRFRNIQDLLEYIRQVADSSPYTRGLSSYNNRQALNARVNNTRQNGTNIPTYPPIGPQGVAPAPPTPVMTAVFEEHIPATRIRVPLNTTANNVNTAMLMNTLLGGMFGDLFGAAGGDAGLQGFLNQRVPVYPSAQEIDRATTIYRATGRQDDICAICQDDIDTNQEFRQVNHCSHSFHRECIDTWFQGNVHCPTCRHDIREVVTTAAENNNNININRNVRENNENNNRQDNQTRMNNENNPPPVPDNYRRMNIRRNN